VAEQPPTKDETREAIQSLTFEESRGALFYLVGYSPDAVASALARINEAREESTR
jgi:hypothetical protein